MKEGEKIRKLPDFLEFANSITKEQVEIIQKDSAIDSDELKERFKKEGYSVIPVAFEGKKLHSVTFFAESLPQMAF